jgi:hypothetical protein
MPRDWRSIRPPPPCNLHIACTHCERSFSFTVPFYFAISTDFVTPQYQILIDELSAVSQGKSTHCTFQVEITNKIPISPAQEDALYQVSPQSSLSTIRAWCALALHRLVALAYGGRKSDTTDTSHTTILVPPSRSESPILIDPHSEFSLMEGNNGCRWIGNKRTSSTRQPSDSPQRLLTN